MATFPAKTNYAAGDILTAAQMVDIGDQLNALNGSSAGKNYLINGGMDIWQRGTSSSSLGNYYTADRWYQGAWSGTGTWAQESSVVPTGSRYSAKFTASATAQPYFIQAIETANAIQLAGKTATLSAQVAASTSTAMSLTLSYSTSVDNALTGSWTDITATSGGTATPTSTTFVQLSGVYSIPSTAKSLRLVVQTSSTIANTVVIYIGQVQLEEGSVRTSFSRAGGTIAGELAACQRYYEKSYDVATAPGSVTTNGQVNSTGNLAATTGTIATGVRFLVAKRGTPTITFYDLNGNINKCARTTFGVGQTDNQTVTAFQIGQNGFLAESSGTASQCGIQFHYVAAAEL